MESKFKSAALAVERRAAQYLDRAKQTAVAAIPALALCGACLIAGSGVAGTDTTFDQLYDQMLGYYQGSGGKLAALFGLAFATIYSIQNFSFGRFLNAVGIGAAIGLGPGIVTAGVTALI